MCGPRNTSVRTQGDLNAGRIQPSQIAGLNSEECLSLRIVFAFRLNFLKLFGRHALTKPASVHLHSAVGKVRVDDHIGLCLHHIDEFVVNVLVPDAMSEGVDARAQDSLRIFERKDMSYRAQVVLVRLVNNGPIQRRAQLRDGVIPVVHPYLHQIHFLLGQLLDILAGLGFRFDPVGSLCASRFRSCQPASGGTISRGIGDRLLPHLESHVACILAHAHRNSDAVVREMLQLIDKSISSDREMFMRINDRRNDGLAGQVDASGARRNGDLSFSSDSGKPAVVDYECRIHDGGAAIARDEARAFKHRDSCPALSGNHRQNHR